MESRVQGLANFDVEEVLGNSTLLVKNKQNERKVLKKFKCLGESDIGETVEKVRHLAETFRNPYIIDVENAFAVGNDALYLVCQFCEGGSLHALIKRARQYEDVANETEVVEWVIQIALALRHLQSIGLLFNLLCPKNVLLMNNCCKVDCTKLISRELNLSQPSTAVNSYSSPESLSKSCNLFESNDVWALGCCLYELCALKKLFPKKETAMELADDVAQSVAPPFPDMFSDELADVWKSMMLKDPNQRPTLTQILETPFIASHLREMEEIQRVKDGETSSQQDNKLFEEEEDSKSCGSEKTDRNLHFTDLKDDDWCEADDFLTAEDIEYLINPPEG